MKDIDNICLSVEHDFKKDYQTISPEIAMTSSFQFKDFEHYVKVNSQGEFAYTYTRDGNPTTAILEDKIASLEGGEVGRAFASGMGAISAAILSLIKTGDHIIIVNTVYGSSVKLIQQMSKFGVESTKIDVVNTDEIFSFIKDNTKMIYFESPSSQRFEMLDLEMISKVAKEKNIYTMIDNTWATPLLQNPIKHGIDIVMHSCSKYIGGHSDIVGGILVSRKEIIDQVEAFGQILLGATMSPMNAWLAIRGLRTLPVRLQSQEKSLRAVIQFLDNDPRIEKIFHPLTNGPQQVALSNTYLSGYGSLLGVVLKDATPKHIQKFVDALHHFTLAYSWGGFESLIMPVFKGHNEEELKQRRLSLGQLRMYIGLEDSEQLIQDLKQALDIAYQ